MHGTWAQQTNEGFGFFRLKTSSGGVGPVKDRYLSQSSFPKYILFHIPKILAIVSMRILKGKCFVYTFEVARSIFFGDHTPWARKHKRERSKDNCNTDNESLHEWMLCLSQSLDQLASL